MGHKEYTRQDLFAYKDLWHSPMHHGSFSAFTPEETLNTINSRLHHAYKKLPELNWLMVTMGTAYVYKQKESGQVVANCHQLPESHFLRYRLSVEEIVEDYTALITEMSALNPELKWLFTVSPIRHIRDRMHANQLRNQLCCSPSTDCNNCSPERVFYFPSYEIILDELRDYRFIPSQKRINAFRTNSVKNRTTYRKIPVLRFSKRNRTMSYAIESIAKSIGARRGQT